MSFIREAIGPVMVGLLIMPVADLYNVSPVLACYFALAIVWTYAVGIIDGRRISRKEST